MFALCSPSSFASLFLEEMNKKERESIIAAAALVISLMAAFFTCLQWWEARQTRKDVHQDAVDARRMAADQFKVQREDSEDQAQAQQRDVTRAANAADRSARAAEKSASLAENAQRANRELFQVSERARVFIKNIELTPPQASQELKVQVTVENFGKTPANQMEAYGNVQVRDSALPQNPQDEPAFPTRPRSSAVLMPSDTVGLPILGRRPLTGQEVDAINSGASLLYVFGHLEYLDVFGQRHETRFCSQYNPQFPQRLNICPYYNSAD
jgi:hypothetical protein